MHYRATMHLNFAAAAALYYRAFCLGVKESLEYLKILASARKLEGRRYLALAYEHQIASPEVSDNDKPFIFQRLGKLYVEGIAGTPDIAKAADCYYRAYRDFKAKASLYFLQNLAAKHWTAKAYLGLAYLADKDMVQALEVADFLHNHPQYYTQPIWSYLQFKLHLQGLRGTKTMAYDYYQAYPALKELLTAEDYYELGNMLLHSHIFTPNAISADGAHTLLQASQCFYKAHQRGDSEAYPMPARARYLIKGTN